MAPIDKNETGLTVKTTMASEKIIAVVSEVFSAMDECRWLKVKSLMAGEILLEYTGLSVVSTSLIQPDQFIKTCKNFLSGFNCVQHKLYDFKVHENGWRATVKFKGNVTHRTEKEVWTAEENYNADLEKIRGRWRITMLQFAHTKQVDKKLLPLPTNEKCKVINMNFNTADFNPEPTFQPYTLFKSK